MLKLLGTPVSYLAASFHNMYVFICLQWLTIFFHLTDSMPDGVEEDLVTILNVKGASKQEKTECLNEFRESE